MGRGKGKIFWKVFWMTVTMLGGMIVLAYVLLYLLLPNFYKSYKIEQYEKMTEAYTQQFASISDFGEEVELLSNYAQQNGISLKLYNDENQVLYDFYQGNYIVTSWDTTQTVEEEIGTSVEVDGNGTEISQNIQVECQYRLKDGTRRYLTIMVPLQPLNEAKTVMIRIYPVACVICILFALVFALIFSRVYVKPIRQISRLTRKMSQLEWDIEIPVYSSDEIGELSEDINHLYKELRGTIDTLNVEIKRYSDAENRKIGFLRTVSHELKTPLAAANALIEGIIYEIPPYNKDQKKYLAECKKFLEEAVELVRESLSLSKAEYGEQIVECNVKDLIGEVVSDYTMILRSKQIEYVETLPVDFTIQTRAGVLKKALSNIISNAVNYTPQKGSIEIYYENEAGILTIENTCTPLSSSELDKMFEPFYSGQNDNKMSNGLGLSIVKQLLGMLHIPYEFVPAQNQQGMQFRLFIKSFA